MINLEKKINSFNKKVFIIILFFTIVILSKILNSKQNLHHFSNKQTKDAGKSNILLNKKYN
jgi:hypothetical protein